MRLATILRRACVCAYFLLAGTLSVQAQSGIAPPTRTLAITGATVVTAPGTELPGATVVIRDGLITAVGTGVSIPYDARVIEADTLFVYAGFIDPLSYVGQEPPRQGGGSNQDPVADRDNPPFDRAGLEPYRSVRDHLDPEHASVKNLRDAGFTAAHAVPRGRMMPGKGSVVLLRGESADAMVVAPDVSQFIQFQGASGVYPGTPMAMTARMRQVYREAERRLALTRHYRDDPTGLAPPPVDPLHTAFFDVIEGAVPIFFYVEDPLEAHRALTLREELGFRLVLTGLPRGHELAGKLARSGVAVAVTTDFPEKPGWMASVKRDSLLEVVEMYDPDQRTATWRDTEAEARNLESRQALAREDYLANAAALTDAGMRIAFTSLETPAAEIHAHIREMLAAGLDTTAALAALTTQPAELIGMSRAMGTVERGKMGNLVIADGPLFHEDTQLRHVVIEGEVFDIEARTQTGEAGDADSSLVGTWSLVAETPEGDIRGSFEVRGMPGSLRGVVSYEGVPQPIDVEAIEERGDQVLFSFQSPDGFIAITLTRTGDSMRGSASVDGGEAITVTMTRSNPE